MNDLDLENALCAALDGLPASQSRPENIGARLGLSARETGLHGHKTRRRTFNDGRGQVAAVSARERDRDTIA